MRVLVVDDHPLFRDGIRSLLLSHDFQVVGEASNGLEAVAKTKELKPELVLMDVRMPRMGGVEATRLLKAENPALKIVMLTASDDDDDVFEAIKSGADGYLLKSLQSDEFFRLLAGVERDESPISPTLAAKILHEFVQLQRVGESRDDSSSEGLTARELEVLELLADGSVNSEIAAALVITESTVKFHVKNIMGKLHLQNRGQVIAYATRHKLAQDPGRGTYPTR